jgi:hypothetical protein
MVWAQARLLARQAIEGEQMNGYDKLDETIDALRAKIAELESAYAAKCRELGELKLVLEQQDINLKRLKEELSNRCEHCGAKLNLNGCVVCGAPVCCPSCCRVATLESEVDGLEYKLASEKLYPMRKLVWRKASESDLDPKAYYWNRILPSIEPNDRPQIFAGDDPDNMELVFGEIAGPIPEPV